MAKVLLVEDDNNLREIYQARLTAEGYDIVAAEDGEAALSLAKQNHPDLIISDVMMPRISGFEMLDILRNTDELKHTKVIMLTALGQAEDRSRGDNLGADKYLVKSQVTLEDIVTAAKELLGDMPAPVAAPAPELSLPAPAPASPAPEPVATPAAVPEPVAPVVEPTPAPAPAMETVVPVVPETPEAPAPAPTPVTTVNVSDPDPLQPIISGVSTSATSSPVTAPEPVADTSSQGLMQHSTPSFDVPTPPAAFDPTAGNDQAPANTEQASFSPVTPQPEEPVAVEPIAGPSPTPGPALTLEDEEATVKAQIESFINNPATSTAPTPAEPVVTPAPETAVSTANDALIEQAVDDLNTATGEGEAPALAPSEIAAAATQAAAEPETTDSIDTLPTEEVPAPADEPTPAPQPTSDAPVSAPVEVIQPTVDTDNVNVAGKKVISPITDPTAAPNLDELLAKEAAKAQGPVVDPNAPVAPSAVVSSEPAEEQPAPPRPSGPDPNSIAL